MEEEWNLEIYLFLKLNTVTYVVWFRVLIRY